MKLRLREINKRKFKRFRKNRVGSAVAVAHSAVKPDINGCHEYCTYTENKTKIVFSSKSNSLLTKGHIFHKRSTRGQKNCHNL